MVEDLPEKHIRGQIVVHLFRIDLFCHYLDAEIVVNSENKPIDLKNLEAPHLPGGGGTERLPQGARR